MTPSIVFDPAFLTELEESTKYEMWFLEAVYDLAGKPLFLKLPDSLIYTPSENKPTLQASMSGNIVIGDWRPGLLKAGAPLVFVSAFKLLDMLMERVLLKNGFPPNKLFKFQQKILRVKAGIQFPNFIESRAWLKDRLIGFYETLEPLRGTIIHAKQFSATNGNLKVSSSRGGVVWPEVTITGDDLRALAIQFISVIRYVDGSWTIDELREKTLRRKMDVLHQYHGLSTLGQLEPYHLTTRIYREVASEYRIDIKDIRTYLAGKYPNQDTFFDLRIILAEKETQTIASCLVPWSTIERSGDLFECSHSDMIAFSSSIPDDILPEKIMKAMFESPAV